MLDYWLQKLVKWFNKLVQVLVRYIFVYQFVVAKKQRFQF